MAQICTRCGKKIHTFSNDPLELGDGRVLCYDCVEPIRSRINQLYYAKSSAEFERQKSRMFEVCEKLYDKSIINAIAAIIDKIYNSTAMGTIKDAENKRTVIANHMLTTGYDFSGFKILKYIGVISGQVVLGTGFLSEFTASFADFFGEESNRFAQKLEAAKNAAVEKLVMKSNENGGNAIIGVDFDYITFHGNMIGVVANGTCVVVEKNSTP